MFFADDELAQLEANALVTKKFFTNAETLNDVIAGYDLLSAFFQVDYSSNTFLFESLGLLPSRDRTSIIADKIPVALLCNEEKTQSVILSEAVHVLRGKNPSYLLFGLMDPPNRRTGNFFSLLNVAEQGDGLFERDIGHLHRNGLVASSLTMGQYARELIKSYEVEIPLEDFLKIGN